MNERAILAAMTAALCLGTMAVAPCGGSHLSAPHAIQLVGTITEGGVPGSFTKIIDLQSGRSVLTQTTGVDTETQGFNGLPWAARNGIVVQVDAAPYVTLARATAFVDRLAWTRGETMPSVHVRLGPGGLADAVTIDADQGPKTVVLSEWRCVGGVNYPFQQTTTDASGERSVLQVSRLQRAVATSRRFAAPAAQNHAFVRGASPAEVPFVFTGPHDPHILVTASVQGHEARLVFDTGSDHYFGVSAAQAWGLDVSGGVNISGAGAGSLSGGFVHVNSISIGGAELRDQIAVVAPLPWPSGPKSADGLTGFQFLAQLRTTIDYQNRILRFENFDTPPAPSDGAAVHFYTDADGHMYVTASVNGAQGLFEIDTGDGDAITLFNASAKRAGINGLDAVAHSSGTAVGGSVPIISVQAESFSLAGNTLNNPHVKVAKIRSGAFASKGVAGNLGGGLFRCFALTIDYRARTITFTKQPDTADCLAKLQST